MFPAVGLIQWAGWTGIDSDGVLSLLITRLSPHHTSIVEGHGARMSRRICSAAQGEESPEGAGTTVGWTGGHLKLCELNVVGR